MIRILFVLLLCGGLAACGAKITYAPGSSIHDLPVQLRGASPQSGSAAGLGLFCNPVGDSSVNTPRASRQRQINLVQFAASRLSANQIRNPGFGYIIGDEILPLTARVTDLTYEQRREWSQYIACYPYPVTATSAYVYRLSATSADGQGFMLEHRSREDVSISGAFRIFIRVR